MESCVFCGDKQHTSSFTPKSGWETFSEVHRISAVNPVTLVYGVLFHESPEILRGRLWEPGLTCSDLGRLISYT